jgi:hypothetical protein
MKPIEPSANIDRRALVSTLAFLPTLPAPFLSISASAQTATSSGALPSWNEGTAKQAILDFVRDTTTPANPKFVPPGQRIAGWSDHNARAATDGREGHQARV